MNTSLFTADNLSKIAAAKNYVIFRNDEKEYNLNYWAVRTKDVDSDAFNDYRVMFWWYKGKLEMVVHNVTTDPGLYWRLHPMNSAGCGVLLEGQWRGCWTPGLHYGDPALNQLQPVTVIRDFDKDAHIDIIYDQIYLGKCTKKPSYQNGVQTVEYFDQSGAKVYMLQTGWFGVNHHHAGEDSQKNWNWSAACQVTQKMKDHNEFVSIYSKAVANFGKAITYTLVAERDFDAILPAA
jgi:hypothetical protein